MENYEIILEKKGGDYFEKNIKNFFDFSILFAHF